MTLMAITLYALLFVLIASQLRILFKLEDLIQKDKNFFDKKHKF